MSFQFGKYHARVIDGEMTTTQNGKPQMSITIQPTHFDDGGWQPVEGDTKRTMYLQMHGNSQPHSMDKLSELGFNGDFKNPQFAERVLAEGIEVVCKEWFNKDGKSMDGWDLVKWGSGQAAACDVDDGVLNQLNAMWSTTKGKNEKPAPASPYLETTPAPVGVTSPVDDDDIPF